MRLFNVFFLSGLISIVGCTSRSANTSVANTSDADSANETVVTDPIKELPPLVADTIFVDEKDFGEVIELKGQQKVLDCEPFRVSGDLEMWMKDGHFLMQNHTSDGLMYMLFKMPDWEHVTSFGIVGNGPDEFMFPHIAPTSQKDVFAYLYEDTRNKLYRVDTEGNMTYVPITFEKVKNAVHSEKRIFAAENDTYYYAEHIKQGRAFFKAQWMEDSLHTEQLYNLSFSPKHKSWSAYIGDFVVHPHAKRLVYAYKYFKRILFFDPETKEAKVLDFNKDGVVAANDIITLGPENVTYYWGGPSVTDDYFYITYSGRTPIQISKETSKTDSYIFVEQFDWNGTPIRKFKLDHWGRAYIDESNKKIFQFCYLYDDPLFVYDIP